MPRGGGTVNQYSETEVGGLTLSDWDYTETSDKIILTKYKGDQVNVVIPSVFEGHETQAVEIADLKSLLSNLRVNVASKTSNNKLVSIKIGTTDQKVTLGSSDLGCAFSISENGNSFPVLEEVDLSGLDTSNVTSMMGMFLGCDNLTSVKGLETLDTGRVTDMGSMFLGCKTLKSIDVSHFNTSNVVYMVGVFYGCESLETLDLSSFDTSSVLDMKALFQDCYNLKNIAGLETFDTGKVTDMNRMFYDCKALENLNLSAFDTSNVTDMKSMFEGCLALKTLDLSNFNTGNVVDMSRMFYECFELQSINGLENFNTRVVEEAVAMFYNCKKLNVFDLSRSNFNIKGDFWFHMASMFTYNPNETQLVPAENPIPTIIVTKDPVITDHIDEEDMLLVYNRMPYYAKVIYHSHDETFADGSNALMKILYQSDHFIYSTMEEAKQEFTLTGKAILKDAPSVAADKEGTVWTWYLDEACTMPLDETSSVDFTTLADGTLQLYAGYKEVTPETPEDTPDTSIEEITGSESNIQEVKKEEPINTGDHTNQSMYYILLGGSVIVLGAMAYKHRKSV